MKQSIMFSLVYACLVSTNVIAGPFSRLRSPENQLWDAFKRENTQRADTLLKKHPELAQIRDHSGQNLAHHAALTLNPLLLVLADKYAVDMLQEDRQKITPIELLGLVFKSQSLKDHCQHLDHTTASPGLSNTIRQSLLANLGATSSQSIPINCPQVRTQNKLKDCMEVFLNRSEEHINRHCQQVARQNSFPGIRELSPDIPVDLHQLILTMTLPERHIEIQEIWLRDPALFLHKCPNLINKFINDKENSLEQIKRLLR